MSSLFNPEISDDCFSRANVFELLLQSNRVGEFTQNLLKLTGFPFSYSLIALLALIFGHDVNREYLSLNEIAPLLILMGFVATTLSIWDPVGGRQRAFLRKQGLVSSGEMISKGKIKPVAPEPYPAVYNDDDIIDGLITLKIFGKKIISIFSTLYLFTIRYAPKDVKKYEIDWNILNQSNVTSSDLGNELKKIGSDELEQIFSLLEGLRDRVIKSKWITAEIDRITALAYFLFVIIIFTIAISIDPGFLQIFVLTFGNNEIVKIVIIGFAILSLVVVLYNIQKKIRGLQDKAVIVFKYLTALETMRTKEKDFKTPLENIEHYLDSNDWTLAGYWLLRAEKDYQEWYLAEVEKR